jgi:hypothetical protein
MSYGEAYLIHVTHGTDEINQTIDDETKIKIPVEINSIGRSEWSAAGQQGLNPSMMLVTAAINYQNEETVEIYDKNLDKNIRYAIYRTYKRPDDGKIELYIKKEAGI